MVQNRQKVNVRKELKKRKGEKGINPGWVKGRTGGNLVSDVKIALRRSLKCRCAEWSRDTKWKMKFTCF